MLPRILVVEDSAALARPLVRLLKRLGYDVEHVSSCAPALALEESFDLGVIDIELPDGVGIDLLTRLLERGTIASGVFYTGSLDKERLKRASEIASVVKKSESIDLLLEAIARTLAERPQKTASS